MESLIAYYQQLVDTGVIADDPTQGEALQALHDLSQQLQAPYGARAPRGIYLFGPVGRGKTFLMDLLVSALPAEICRRQHFHHFMAYVHQQLKDFSGCKDPLQLVARDLRQKARVLCFDEFFVSDIGDAILLGTLMQALFRLDMVLVATSNLAPRHLYLNGLQRERFLPAIDALETHTRIIALSGPLDHRENLLQAIQVYYLQPATCSEIDWLHADLLSRIGLPFVSCSAGHNKQNSTEPTSDDHAIHILGRPIPCVSKAARTICFEFSALCEGPRSHMDYQEIASQYDTLLLLDVPALGGTRCERIKARGTEDSAEGSGATGERQVLLAPSDDAARRFIALIDEFYARKIALLLTCRVPLEQLYEDGSLLFEFARTRSRLREMGSAAYQAGCRSSR